MEEFHADYSIIKNDQIIIENVEQFSKILISPGPGLPSRAGLVKEIISKYASSKTILGVCLGHQAIAEVFGGELYNFQTVHHGVPTKVNIIDTADYLFENFPSAFDAGLYHSWAVSRQNFPDCLKITSVGNDDVIMSISHVEYDVKGIQFHPESIMTLYGKHLIQNWLRR